MTGRFSLRRIPSVLGGLGGGALAALIVLTACQAGPPAPTSVVRPPAAAGKVMVDGEGPVALTHDDLSAIGWQDVALDQVHVMSADREVPAWVHDNTLQFYATISPTRYMTESVYWLKPGAPAARLLETAAPSTAGPAIDHYSATLHAELNRVYAPQVKEGDHWFWAQLPAPTVKTFTVTLSAVAAGPAHLRIEVWAATEGAAKPDHHYQVELNGQVVADDRWDGMGRHTIECALPTGLVKDGENILRLTAPGDTGVAADTTYLDWFDVVFPRRFVAEADRLTFDSTGGPRQLIGFSGGPIDVYDVTQPDRIAHFSIEPSTSLMTEAGHRYWVVGPRGYRSGQVTAADLQPDLRASANAAEYVAIGPGDLLDPLKPLLDWHAAHGLTAMAVPVAAVYDQFGEGRVSPEAIRSFLQFAGHTWATAPHDVLLVGDASYDPLDYVATPDANRLPTFLVQTVYGGETGSDVGFAQFGDDPKPQLAVGRVPARTPQQVKTFVDKTLAYLQSAPAGAWRTRVLAVADGQEPSFKTEAQAFLDRFTARYQTALINPPANTAGANQQILKAMNAGNLLVGYFGHGSITQWGKDNLFTVKDGAALSNGSQLAVVLNFTCLTGLFTHPRVQSLAETLLWKADGGAVAVVAPTSLTLASDQSLLSNALIDAYVADPLGRLGDFVLKAWQAMPTDGDGSRDVLRTFLLFGDPALRLAQP